MRHHKGEVHGVPYDSDEEKDFICWLARLKKAGLCDFERGVAHTLFDGLKVPVKNRAGTKELLKPMTYTFDFTVRFDPVLSGKLTWTNGMKPGLIYVDGTHTAHIEIKGTFRKFDTDYEAPVKIKMLYLLENIYVEILKPYKLFAKTFFPEEMYYTPKDVKPRIKDGKQCNKYTFKNFAERSGLPAVPGGKPFVAEHH